MGSPAREDVETGEVATAPLLGGSTSHTPQSQQQEQQQQQQIQTSEDANAKDSKDTQRVVDPKSYCGWARFCK